MPRAACLISDIFRHHPMSKGKAPNWAAFFSWRQAILASDLTSTQKLVALALSTYMNEHGEGAFPSHETLAQNCSMARETVSRTVSKLVEAGWFRLQKMHWGGQGWRRHAYRVSWPDGGCDAASPPYGAGDSGSEACDPDTRNVVTDDHTNSPRITGVDLSSSNNNSTRDPPKAELHHCPADWQPSQTTRNQLVEKKLIHPEFIDELLGEFVAYWSSQRAKNCKRAGWDATFFAHVISRWSRDGYGWCKNKNCLTPRQRESERSQSAANAQSATARANEPPAWQRLRFRSSDDFERFRDEFGERYRTRPRDESMLLPEHVEKLNRTNGAQIVFTLAMLMPWADGAALLLPDMGYDDVEIAAIQEAMRASKRTKP